MEYKPHPHLPKRDIAAHRSVMIHKSAEIDQNRRTTIGAWTVICRDVLILGHIHDPLDGKVQQDYYHVGAPETCVFPAEPLYIGQHCWIGARVLIMPQVTNITDEVIIGAGSVVTRNLDEPGVYAGNPCRRKSAYPGHTLNAERRIFLCTSVNSNAADELDELDQDVIIPGMTWEF